MIAIALLLLPPALPPARAWATPPLPVQSTVRSISQFDITWTFATDVVAGQFANGDWWVLGPVDVVSIDPPSKEFGEHTRNGSMINPSPRNGIVQGYDSSMYGQYVTASSYDESLNVAFGVSAATPLRLAPHSSLVSTISNTSPGVREQLTSAAILTVLGTVPPADAFRPPYCGSDKTIRHRAGRLNWSLLKELPRVASTPSMATVEAMFERPWIDHVPTWIGGYIHPSGNMPNYGRDMTDHVGIASLMLQLDFTHPEKEKLLISLVQLGIDLFGIVKDGGKDNWQAGGGHHSGRKWPILFAGAMLTNLPMARVGLDPSYLFMGEDGQTFYVEETSPGVYNNGFGGYAAQHVGMPEWGIKHALVPADDDVDWFADPYRVCCTANSWTGQLLAVRIMGARWLWNHPALFDYQDRYVQIQKQNGGSVATSRFSLDMWDQYRSQY